MNGLRTEIEQLPVNDQSVAIWGLGQTGYVIKGREHIIYIDPYLTDTLRITTGDICTRLFPPPLEPEEICNATAVFCTHGHGDHLDPVTLQGISKYSPLARFIVPHIHLRDVTALGIPEDRVYCPKQNQRQSIGNVEFIPISAAHPQVEYDNEGYSKYLGYLFFFGEITLFHAGDTVLYPEIIDNLKQYSIDIAILPINGRDYWRERANIIGNLDYKEAVQLAAAISAKVLIPSHNDLFAANRCNPAYLVDYLDRLSSGQRMHFLQVGEPYVFVKV